MLIPFISNDYLLLYIKDDVLQEMESGTHFIVDISVLIQILWNEGTNKLLTSWALIKY